MGKILWSGPFLLPSSAAAGPCCQHIEKYSQHRIFILKVFAYSNIINMICCRFIWREGLYCLGFFETKSHNGKDVNQMRIENIAGCELLKKEESVDDVLVVYCAKHPAHKFTTVVGWYKHATVFRHYQEAVFAPEDVQYYNAIANSSDCVLLPAGNRSRKVQWEVPRKSNGWAYGFGRANVWYASEEDSRLQDYLTRLVKQIDEYDGENWIDKYAES